MRSTLNLTNEINNLKPAQYLFLLIAQINLIEYTHTKQKNKSNSCKRNFCHSLNPDHKSQSEKEKKLLHYLFIFANQCNNCPFFVFFLSLHLFRILLGIYIQKEIKESYRKSS